MVFRFNPFTNNLDDVGDGSPSTGDVLSLTGNAGGPILPDGAGNIDVVGTSQRASALGSTTDGGGLFFTGNPGAFTLTGTWESFGTNNTFLGQLAGNQTLSGEGNTCIGYNAGANFTANNNNTLIGKDAGSNYSTTESGNILVGSDGKIGDESSYRFGPDYDGDVLPTGWSNGFYAGQLVFMGKDKGIVVGALTSGDYTGFINNSVNFGSNSAMSGNTQFVHGNNCSNTSGGSSVVLASQSTDFSNGTSSALIACESMTSSVAATGCLYACGGASSSIAGDQCFGGRNVAIDGTGSFAWATGSLTGTGSVLFTDDDSTYNLTADHQFITRFGGGLDLNNLTVGLGGSFVATFGQQNNTVTQVTRVANSSTVNQTYTSSAVTLPYVVGAFKEIVFNTLCTNVGSSTVAAGWSTTSGAASASSLLGPYSSVFFGTPSNGNNLIFTSPINIDEGCYLVEYQILTGTNAAIVDLSVTLGGGSPIPLRTNFDAYQNFVSGIMVSMKEFFTCSASNQSLVLTWNANGKNASSSNYQIAISDCLRIIKLG